MTPCHTHLCPEPSRFFSACSLPGWYLSTMLVILLTLGIPLWSSAQQPLPGTPLFGPSGLPLAAIHRIPISSVLTHPEDYHLREIHLTGVITNTVSYTPAIGCGRPFILTAVTVEDSTGSLTVHDQGACAGYASRTPAATLHAGDTVDLYVRVIANTRADTDATRVEVRILWSEILTP